MIGKLLFLLTLSAGDVVLPADTPEVRYVGRTEISSEKEVAFDWSGTYFSTILCGKSMKMAVSSEGESWFNVFTDGVQTDVICINTPDTLVTVVDGLSKGKHEIRIQKRTEGEFGNVRIKNFVLPRGASLQCPESPSRHIEFIGNSLTCGFGTEGKSADEPFKLSTENCNLSYSTRIADYFSADYTLIAHSGQGAVRNYGDSVRVSKVNMQDRMLRAFDMKETLWQGGYTPDIVVISLGSNDFSTEPHPYKSEFVKGYSNIISQIRSLYGGIPVLCVCPPVIGGPLYDYLREIKRTINDPAVYIMELTPGLYNSTTDLGSVCHPNASGQLKMAMAIIPYISTITGWEMKN